MFKKYKFKKRKKILNIFYIFILFVIITLFMTYGYAYFSDSLKISGKANILTSDEDGDDEDIVYGNSTYSSTLSAIWGSSGSYTHNFQINITNMDQDFAGTPQIEISFDLVEGLILTESSQCNIWQAESIIQTGKTVIITFTEASSYVSLGGTITLYPHFVFPEEYPDLLVTNLKLNGKAAQLETST